MAALGVADSCSCCKAAMAANDWSYESPSQWSGTCNVGAEQSPIDVSFKKARRGEALGKLKFDYKMSNPTFTNPGHGTMEVVFPEGENKLWLNGRELNLVQVHFHTPSEHAFGGLRFPMEAHLVHQDANNDKAFAVVGIMLGATPDAKSNGALAAVYSTHPSNTENPCFVITCSVMEDLQNRSRQRMTRSWSMFGSTLLKGVQLTAADLIPPTATKNDIQRYIHYLGSFTTPNCEEGVDWLLLEKPLIVLTDEVLEFLKFVGDDQTLALNSRPLQPLGVREIFKGP